MGPQSSSLDSYRASKDLSHLGGHGVLEGDYVDIRNGLKCSEGFNAFSAKNEFMYSHQSDSFQEAMSYYYGDSYRTALDGASVLLPTDPVMIVAHCMLEDNAFYTRYIDANGVTQKRVCLGDSVTTPGASYADDASVVVHELQHATTIDSYSVSAELNQFWYDEAGAINEGVSDFMALSFLEPIVPLFDDPALFSRWALGTFDPHYAGERGAHTCPEYDPQYPTCRDLSAGGTLFSAAANRVSYVYPDGLGWPYGRNFTGPGFVRNAFRTYTAQEEIHNAGAIATGALWDAYLKVKALRSDSASAFQAMSQVTMTAIKQLTKPSTHHRSPVTFTEFGDKLAAAADATSGVSAAESTAIKAALRARGILDAPQVPSGWLTVGPGQGPVVGMKIMDNPIALKSWVLAMGVPGTDVADFAQSVSTGNNGRLDAGESVIVWFDLGNSTAVTAGGIELTVQALDPEITFLNENYNFGLIDSENAQIRYGKVNGSAIVASLNDSANSALNVPTGNSYFQTDPHFDQKWTTALWVHVSPTAAHGKNLRFQVTASPANGPASTTIFATTVP